ncbi:MAG TPA: hypothetical protein IGS52_00840 [Oscillatoriaceae cyanobacterium M33_DOE_052]|uniref:AlgX/AlgJ SGNH hydrolase-like domain-containing protein n=1 Tax=Planktothricoides sp. SpSt-374 TaxID=2282167 RepID=A0A7C3VP53_9CYAN|nr:hypothetical protein [Oscillatoriaceae cyanobacterium M33_DOE_052]
MRQLSQIQRLHHVIICCLFVPAIWTPIVISLWRYWRPLPNPSNWEKRQLASLPNFQLSRQSLANFPRLFDAYYNDNFGGRQQLIYWHNRILFSGLKQSPSEQVIIGKDGWLFYGHTYAIESYRATAPFTEAQLKHWQQILEERRDWLNARGIPYLVVFVPEKQSIYPEYLPQWLQPVGAESRLDQLMKHLQLNSDLAVNSVPSSWTKSAVIDLRDILLAAKSNYRIYHRTDSHWNKPGVFTAAGEIIKYLAAWFPQLKPLRITDFDQEIIYRDGGDLANMLGLKDVVREEVLKFSPRLPPLARPVAPEIARPDLAEDKQPFAMATGDRRLPRAVMFHDSFALNLAPLIAEKFQRIVFLSEYEFDLQVIDKERPDVVIQEMVERQLMAPLPDNPPQMRNF